MKETIECMVVDVGKDCVKARAKLHGDCSSCGLCEGSNAVYYEAVNKAGAKCGQSVLLEVEKQSVLKVAFLVFVLPLFNCRNCFCSRNINSKLFTCIWYHIGHHFEHDSTCTYHSIH